MDTSTLYEKSSDESKQIYGDELNMLINELNSVRSRLLPYVKEFAILFSDYERLIKRLFAVVSESEFLKGLNMAKHLK